MAIATNAAAPGHISSAHVKITSRFANPRMAGRFLPTRTAQMRCGLDCSRGGDRQEGDPFGWNRRFAMAARKSLALGLVISVLMATAVQADPITWPSGLENWVIYLAAPTGSPGTGPVNDTVPAAPAVVPQSVSVAPQTFSTPTVSTLPDSIQTTPVQPPSVQPMAYTPAAAAPPQVQAPTYTPPAPAPTPPAAIQAPAYTPPVTA